MKILGNKFTKSNKSAHLSSKPITPINKNGNMKILDQNNSHEEHSNHKSLDKHSSISISDCKALFILPKLIS